MSFVFTKEDDLEGLDPVIRNHLPRVIENRVVEFKKYEEDFASRNFESICRYCHNVVRYIHDFARKESYSEIEQVLPLFKEYLTEIKGYK